MNEMGRWEEANQACLMAELAELRAALATLLSPAEAPPADAASPAPTSSHAADVGAALVAAQGQPRGLPLQNRTVPEEFRTSLPVPPALDTLCATFGLTSFERKILLMCAGVELDSRFARLCAAVNQDLRSPLPTFSLALAAFADAHWSALLPARPLRYWRLVEVMAGETLTTSPLRIDERILHYLAGVASIDERLRGLTEPLRNARSALECGSSLPLSEPEACFRFEGRQQAGDGQSGSKLPHSKAPAAQLSSEQRVAAQVAASWARAGGEAAWPVVQICGNDLDGRRAVAGTACAMLGLNLRDMSAQLAPRATADLDLFIRLWEREAALDPTVLLLEYDDADTPDAQGDAALKRLVETIRSPLLISSRDRLRPLQRRVLTFEVPQASAPEQLRIWKEALGEAAVALDGKVEMLVSQFSLSAGNIHAAIDQAISGGADVSPGSVPDHARSALECGSSLPLSEPEACFRFDGRQQAGARQSGSELPHSKAPSTRETATPGYSPAGADLKVGATRASGDLGGATTAFAALWDACRMQARPRLEGLAQRIEPSAAWDDLVLPDKQKQLLRQIALHVRQRSKVYQAWGFASKGARGLGISALFAGPSGTGKTMAGEVLANELRLDLYRIDLSQVVSKYIGETEKNLRRVFDAAEEGAAILLFDEADALFGKRSEVKDSHDRYANIEIGYLLQRMEAYRGLAILTTNRKEALDFAFLRRIRFVVEFPFPEAAQRAEIWRRVFPLATPKEGLRIDRLARLSAAGGNIHNIAMGAAFLAADAGEPVRMSHLLAAARSEFTKIERPLTEAETAGWV